MPQLRSPEGKTTKTQQVLKDTVLGLNAGEASQVFPEGWGDPFAGLYLEEVVKMRTEKGFG